MHSEINYWQSMSAIAAMMGLITEGSGRTLLTVDRTQWFGPYRDCEHLRDRISKFPCNQLRANLLVGISDTALEAHHELIYCIM
jgi:hypothetical protein